MSDQFVCAFQTGYAFDEVGPFLSLPSDDDRRQVRQGLSAKIDPSVSDQTKFHNFGTRPDLSELVAYVNASILPSEYTVSSAEAVQEHVWRQGAWICESRFTVLSDSTGQKITQTVTVDGEDFTAHTYYVSAYITH